MADIDNATPTLPPAVWTDRDKDQASTDALVDLVCAHCAGGGTIIDLSEMWAVPMGVISNWLRKDITRHTRYSNALLDQNEWYVQRLRGELRSISLVDVRKIFDDEGRLRPMKEWPDDVAHAVSSIETDEIFDIEGEGREKRKVIIGQTRKVKLEPRTGAIKLLGGEFGMFKRQLVVEGKLTLEQLLDQTVKREAKDA